MRSRGLLDFEAHLRRRLRGARRVAIIGVGDELMPSDRLGMLAAREIDRLQLPAARVFYAGTVPESVTGPVRRYRPSHILFLDAADMGARPGAVAVVDPDRVRARLFTTHALPLSVVMEYLGRDTKAGVTLVGIQPEMEAFGPSPSAREQAGLTHLVAAIQRILSARPEAEGRRTRPRSRAR